MIKRVPFEINNFDFLKSSGIFTVIFFSFFIGAYKIVSSINPEFGFENLNNLLNFKFTSLNLLILGVPFKFFLMIFPIIVLSLLEFFIVNATNKDFSTKMSINRILLSKDINKYSDVFYYFITNFVLKRSPTLVLLATAGIASFSEKLSQPFNTLYSKIIPYPSSQITAVFIFCIAILLAELSEYIAHRTAHTIPFVWDLHEFHHSATEMNIFCKDRNTPLESAITTPIIMPINIFSGLLLNEYISRGFFIPTLIYLIYMTLEEIATIGGHCSYPIIYPKPLSHLLMSPACHLIHHSINPKHYDCNMGTTFTIWDKIFGTYLDESHLKEINGFGVLNSEYNKVNPFFSILFLPVLKLIRRIKFKLI